MTQEERLFTLIKRLESLVLPKINPRGRPPRDLVDRLGWHIKRFTKLQCEREKKLNKEVAACKMLLLRMAREQTAFLEKLQEYNPEHVAAVSRDYFLTRPERHDRR